MSAPAERPRRVHVREAGWSGGAVGLLFAVLVGVWQGALCVLVFVGVWLLVARRHRG